MDEEEPAWRAELREALDERFPYVRNTVTRDAIREFVTEQIEFAEQRGRQEALREVAEKIRHHWYPRVPGNPLFTQGMDAGMDKAADLIDPARVESP